MHRRPEAPVPPTTPRMTAGRLAGVSSEDTREIRSDSALGREISSRDAAPQFVLPLVVRIEKTAPPARTDALETAARAVLAILADERSTGDGEWAEAVRDWQDARIRKVVRRARGAEWRKAGTLPGITVTGTDPDAEAEVRVFPPVPLDGWPRELAKLQVSGTELDDPRPPAAPDPAHPVLWLSPTLEMSAGKAMAQAGHGAQLAWLRLSQAQREAWREAGFALSVRTADPAGWRALTASGLPVVRDAGFTEIAPGSCTVVADHPALRERAGR
ncbi:peptidyl-tRNA hydrolase [Streptomyces sp. NPDC002835]